MADQSTTTTKLLVSVEQGIKTICFNQEKKKNALNRAMSEALRDAVLASKDDGTRVIVLTGAGKDFCAGADLDPSMMVGGFNVSEFLRQTYNPAILAMREMDIPIIAKIRGVCVGAGFNFALACDMLLASETARFSQIFTHIGLSSDAGGAYFMAERLGYHKAFELMALHEMLDAPTALDYGLVNHVYPDADLDQAVDEMAARLAEGPLLAIKHTKSNLRAANQGLAASLEQEAVNQGKNFLSQDFMEGVMAFMQKRKPKFKGK